MPFVAEDFDKKYVVQPNGCWVWQRSIGAGGYGQAWDTNNKKVVKAHRFSYERSVGPIPDGLTIDHLCRVRACVNPAHLEPVTPRTNILRGVAPSARQAQQTHCKNGHALTGDNVYPTLRGRHCRQCRKDYTKTDEHRARRKAYREQRKAAGLTTWD